MRHRIPGIVLCACACAISAACGTSGERSTVARQAPEPRAVEVSRSTEEYVFLPSAVVDDPLGEWSHYLELSDTRVVAVLTETASAAPPPIPAPVGPADAVPSTFVDTPALGYGASGPAVEALQRRLSALGFRPDGDAMYGDATADAVLAFRKYESVELSYEVTPDLWTRLAMPTGLRPAPMGADRIEVDIERQILFAVIGGQVIIMNSSTANNEIYNDPETGAGHLAVTPVGLFNIYNRYGETVESTLGSLYRPLYFLDGWAVHGSGFVPPWPDSHGCARVSFADIDFLWSTDSAKLGTPVLVHASLRTPSTADTAIVIPGH